MKAPSLDEVKAKAEAAVHIPDVKQPSVQIIAAGGCGTNLLKDFLALNTKFDQNIRYSIIDTSQSNMAGVPKHVVVNAVGDLGSGRDRAANASIISRYLDINKKLVEDATDITIILFSMAGGSGSVIAPLLTHRLMRHSNRAVILVGVADLSSMRDCTNTIRTLESISLMCSENKYYVPLMLFSNDGVGRRKVNPTVVSRLVSLVDMLTSKAITEIDYTDKMNYLRPTAVGCPHGCYLISVIPSDPEGKDVESLPGEPEIKLDVNDMVHVSMVVNDSGLTPDILTTVTYNGISDTKKFFSTIGKPIPQELIYRLNEKAEEYKRAPMARETLQKSFEKEGTVDSTGLVL